MADYFIADGHNIVSRAWYAQKHFTGPDDDPDPDAVGRTAAQMIQRQARAMQIEDRRCLCVYDGGNTQRARLFPGYKGNRAVRPDSLSAALVYSLEEMRKAGIKALTIPDYEADDVIATLVRLLDERGDAVGIYSSDGDLLQLLDHACTVIQPLQKGEVRQWRKANFDAFGGKFPFWPNQLPHYKALKGDDTDSYPGIAKLGHVTASKLIYTYGDIDTVFREVALTPGYARSKLQDAILEGETTVRRNLILATLMDVPGIGVASVFR